MEDIVSQELKGKTLWLTINRPKASNALNNAVLSGIGQGLTRATHSNGEILAVVLTGAGERAFCAGGDLTPNAGGAGSLLQFDYADTHSTYAELLRQVNRFELPLIARVNGAVMAGGMGVLCMCDMAVAASDTRLGLPEVKIGAFAMQVAVVMQHLIGRRKFTELCLTGEPITATEAMEIGLVNYTVPRDELDQKVDWLVGRLIDKSPSSIRRGKNALRAIADMTFEQAMSFMEAQLTTMVLTQDAVEGFRAFNEKRAPVWTGR